jgi:hypothetical protein
MLASLENLVRVARSTESQEFFAQSLPGAYRDMADALRQAHPQLNEEQAEAIAELYFVLVQGLGVLQTIAPEANLPDGDRLAQAVTALAGVEI